MVALKTGWPRAAPWRRRFGAHSRVSLAAGTAGREPVGTLGCAARAGQVQARTAQPGGATSVPALPASRAAASRVEKRCVCGNSRHERNTGPSFPGLALSPTFSLQALISLLFYAYICAFRVLGHL